MPVYDFNSASSLSKELAGSNAWNLGGRFRTFTDNRWVTYSNQYGSLSADHLSSLGTAAAPNLNIDIGGQYVEVGQKMELVQWLLRASDATITAVEMAILFREFGETVSELVWQGSSISIDDSFPGTDGSAAVSWTCPARGMLYPAIKPAGTLTGTAYVHTELFAAR